MNAATLRAQLELPYDLERWRGLLPELLPGVELFTKPQVVPLTSDAQKALATRRRQFGRGRVRDAQGNERVIAFFEVEVKPNVQLTRNRVSLRQIVATCIDEATAHAVLAFFVQPGSDSYRLTYAARESRFDEAAAVRTEETAAKRFTYVLGPGVPCRTAADRLAGLGSDPAAVTLAKVTEAFSVEKLSDEFFEQYRKVHYAAFCQHLIDSTAPADIFGIKLRGLQGKERDKALKPVRDFVKKLLGRLVFLHFLQKKGWLGCPPDRTDWTDGDPQFLKNLFAACRDPDRFHSQALVPLFFDTLNRPNRKNDLFALHPSSFILHTSSSRIPYLNGGLFERDFDAVDQLDFPANLFAALLDFFGQYNFTIDENDPDDHEIGIDPEMLGHIFENLLEDNKDKGAYYTPKPVVQYMCQQSLIYYLQSRLTPPPREGEAPAEPKTLKGKASSISSSCPEARNLKPESFSALERLVRTKTPIDPKDKSSWLAQNARAIEQALDDVKICDPAIGSGAFPIGLLQEIYWTKLTLHPAMDRAKAKRDIIQKSIHGVDIDAGAVEIARLRCWLALIVEEDQPRPLPNLDFKIMQGDSLLESFEGIPLDKLLQPEEHRVSIVGGQQELEMPELRKQLVLTTVAERKKLTDLIDRYFGETDPVRKAEIHKAIDKAVRDHIDYNIRLQRERMETELHQYQADIKFKKKRLAAWEPPAKTVKRIEQLQQAIKENDQKAKRLHDLEHRPERPFFLWRLFFQDVFEKGGFDIVIANPPYVFITQLDSEKKALYLARSGTADYRFDIYGIFLEQAADELVSATGCMCFIIPHTLLSNDSFEKLRRHLIEETQIAEVIDIGPGVFSGAKNEVMILIARGKKCRSDCDNVEVRNATAKTFPLGESTHFVQQKLWLNNPRAAWLVRVDNIAKHLLARVKAAGHPLGNYCTINQGLRTGDNQKYLADRPKGPKWVRAAGGKEVQRYEPLPDSLYVYYEPSILDAPRKREIFESPEKIVVQEIRNISLSRRIVATYDTEKVYCLQSTNVINHLTGVNKPSIKFILGILNSSVVNYYFRQSFPGNNHIPANQLSQIPIPNCAEHAEKEITTLVDRLLAAKKSGDHPTAAALDREIDEQVAKLYGLTPEEFNSLENATVLSAPKAAAKTVIVKEIIPALQENTPYFDISAIRKALQERQLEISDDSLKAYLSEFMAEGLLHDAGRGWYSRLSTAFKLDTAPVTPLIGKLKKAFPLLEFSCWSTQQINPYMHHLLAKFVTFIHMDEAAMASVGEWLGDHGYQAFVNPGKAEVAKSFVVRDKTMVIRPGNVHETAPGSHVMPIEAIVVDLLYEAEKLSLMDPSEAAEAALNIMASSRISMGTLLMHAQKRRVVAPDVERLTK